MAVEADSFLSALAQSLSPEQDEWFDDPVAWIEACVRFPEGLSLTMYQRALAQELVKAGRLAVRGPHGLGKTTLSALLILWFACPREQAGRDWKCITTASAWRQVTKYLWPEVHKWARKLNWERLGRRPWGRDDLRVLSIKLTHGEAFSVVSDDHEKLEGAHADELLYVFDEAKAIPPPTWDAVEGAFSGAGTDGVRALVLAISTPGEPQGRFYEIHRRAPGLDDWATEHVTLEQAAQAGRISRGWAAQRKLQWGESSALYANRVLGEFATQDEDGVIPLSLVERAQSRWEDLHAKCGAAHDCDKGELISVGVDPARSGPDKTALALRFTDGIFELRTASKEGTTETAGRVRGILDGAGGRAVVDVIGIGAGVVDQLRETHAKQVVAFNASEATSAKDRSGELGFLNVRAAAWWHLRELLEDDEVVLPPDDELTGDLTAPHWRVTSSGKIQIESKDEIRRRLGRSTDVGDAVTMAFWPDLLARKVVLVGPLSERTANYWREAG